MQEYQQRNIYVQNFIRSGNYDFDENYSELIGRLCAVESALTLRDNSVGICEELLAACQQMAPYSSIDRICLAARIGATNELAIVDSWNSPRCQNNIMAPGYRCFVRPNSSVLQLREGEIRIYEDISSITESFEKTDKPVQRSLKYIDGMGLKSGLCLPLHVMGEMRGYLFLNSADRGLFNKLSDSDYAILSLLTIISKLALNMEDARDAEYRDFTKQPFAVLSSRLFDHDEFSEHIQATSLWMNGERWNPKIIATGDLAFLYLPSPLAFMTVRVCSSFYESFAKYPEQIQIKSDGEQLVQIEVPISEATNTLSHERYRAKVQRIRDQNSMFKWNLVPAINHVYIQFPFDPFFQKREDVFYSV